MQTKKYYFDNYYISQVNSIGKNEEEWKYENGKIICNHGPCRAVYLWDGENFIFNGKNENLGIGKFDYKNNKALWYYEEQVWYSYQISSKESKLLKCDFIKESKPIDIKISNGIIELDESCEKHVGIDDKWKFSGDFPLPVLLFCIMWSRISHIKRVFDEKNQRKYKRCAKLVLVTINNNPRLCQNCSQNNECVTCSTKNPTYDGHLCKSCAPRKNLCAKCNAPCGESQSIGKLCEACGLGGRGKDCCKLIYYV